MVLFIIDMKELDPLLPNYIETASYRVVILQHCLKIVSNDIIFNYFWKSGSLCLRQGSKKLKKLGTYRDNDKLLIALLKTEKACINRKSMV